MTQIKTRDVKEFWTEYPCNADLSGRQDQQAYFQETEENRYKKEPHIPGIAQFDSFQDLRVLEIGCGIGVEASQFARHGAKYTGVDLSESSIKMSRARLSLMELKGDFVCINAESLPFENGSFDHVFSFGVIHHSPHPDKIVNEIYRLLKPGGTATIMVYNRSSINYYIEIMFLRKIFRLFFIFPIYAENISPLVWF